MSGGESLLAVIFGTCACSSAFSCSLDIDSYGGIVLWLAIMIYMFKALGTICDEYFVPSLEVIVEKLQLSNDVAGATFMAAGSSAPELFTSLVATFLIVGEGGVGTIIGSAIFNILVIVGVTSFVACAEKRLAIWWYPLTRDASFYFLAIVELFVVLYDEEVVWYEALVLLLSYFCYCLFMKFNEAIVDALGITRPMAEVEELISIDVPPQELKLEEAMVKNEESSGDASRESAKPEPPVAHTQADVEDPPGPPLHRPTSLNLHCPLEPCLLGLQHQQSSLQPGEERHFSKASRASKASVSSSGSRRPSLTMHGYQQQAKREAMANVVEESRATEAISPEPQPQVGEGKCRPVLKDPLNLLWEYTMPSAENHYWLLFALSIFFIGACTYVMVDATDRIGCILNLPQFVMGMIFLAAGTSIPDALGSVAVAKQGEGDMAVANALGSNVFDIMLGLGLPWLIKCAMGKKVEFPGARQELILGICVLVAVLGVFILVLVLYRWHLSRKMGALLMLLYFVYVVVYAVEALVSSG